ncbi:MAG: Fe-S-containing hydro-lyase [Bacillota bacterium]
MSQIRLETPLSSTDVEQLEAGDRVLLSGTIYTARDAAHSRLISTLEAGEELPLPLEGQVIYYVGPAPAKPGQAIGSAGPTTSYRMDSFTPQLIEAGLKGMIGKGDRSPEVIESMKEEGAVYLGAIGGAAALIAQCIKSAEVIAYHDLGTEAVRKLEVEDFPVLVVIDSQGNSLYQNGK